VLLTLSSPAMREDKISRHADLIAVLTGLVFVSHPLQTQAVTYIWQRAASMAGLFYLASLCFYAKFRLIQKGDLVLGNFYYACSLILAIAAMLTKENAGTLPLMVLLYEICFFKEGNGIDWKKITPFLCTMLIIPLIMLLTKSARFQEIRGVIEGPGGISPFQYFLTECRVMMTYIRLAFVPVHQNLDYDYPVSRSLFEAPALASLVILITILICAKRMFPKYRLAAFSIYWFFLTLLPESSVIPFRDVIFEHRLYLPLAGYSLFLVSGMYYIWGDKRIKVMILVLAVLLTFNAILTYQRNKVWKNEFTLWDDTVRKSPHKARAYNNRGNAYNDMGRYDRAISDFTTAIELNPGYTDAYYNRGNTFFRNGNTVQAISDLSQAVHLSPKYADAYYNRGVIFTVQGKYGQAISDYTKAIELNPFMVKAYYNRANVYYLNHDYERARRDMHQIEAEWGTEKVTKF